MNTTYVSSYLVNVARQPDGWPLGVSEDTKGSLTEEVAAILSTAKILGQEASLMYVHDRVGNKNFGGSAVWDYRLAVVHRALLSAGASEVWTI